MNTDTFLGRALASLALTVLVACGGVQTGPGSVIEQPGATTTQQPAQRERQWTPEERAALALEEADAAFQRALELYAGSDRGDRDTVEIERLLTEAMSKNQSYATQAWFNVGLVRYEAGDLAGALAAYDQATASDRGTPDVRRAVPHARKSNGGRASRSRNASSE